MVAPLVGAWIETLFARRFFYEQKVAPLVGAWIETVIGQKMSTWVRKSHPSWVRGLKLIMRLSLFENAHVAPLVGAWIETW